MAAEGTLSAVAVDAEHVPHTTPPVAFGDDRLEWDGVLAAFGGNLRCLRLAAGLSQEQLAAL